jgi:small subunit ribosomal protein S19
MYRVLQVAMKVIKIWSRRSTVLPPICGINFWCLQWTQVFAGVLLQKNMIGHKFGEFSPTRTFAGHAGDKKAKRT